MSKKQDLPPLPTSIRIPPDLKTWLEKRARRERQSMSNLIVRILEQLREQEDE